MLKYKIIIKKNHRADILRIDNNYVKFNFSYASNTVLNRNEVNLYYLPSSIFQYIFAKSELTFKQIYLKNIFRSFKPKLLIGHNIDRLIFESKKFLPRLTTIVYQHNIIFDSDIAEYELIYKNFKCDYFFVFDKRHEDIFSKIVDSKYIIVGSVKNNETKYIKNTNKDYSIMYISEFRNYPKENFRSVAQKFIVDCLSDYCNYNNKKLCIALSANRPEKKSRLNIDDELKFFNQKENKFHFERISSFELANKSELCICLSSNLGVELIARKIKVLFLPILELYDNSLKYPYFRVDNSPILFCGLDREVIFKKIDYLLSIDDNTWQNIIKDKSYNFTYDENNTILKEHIDTTLKYN